MSVIIETSVGDVTIDLLIQERPKCCYNFLKLCKMKFYNHCRFHRLEKDFIAQTGDPTGTGEGGHSIFHLIDSEVEKSKYFAREVVPKVNHTRLGTVSMVNNGDDMHGSQFFITLREDLDYLDGVHTVFGYVVEGLETLSKMNELFFSDIIITHTVVLKDPFDDPPSLISKYPDASPEPSEEIISRMCVTHNIEEKPEEDSKERGIKAEKTNDSRAEYIANSRLSKKITINLPTELLKNEIRNFEDLHIANLTSESLITIINECPHIKSLRFEDVIGDLNDVWSTETDQYSFDSFNKKPLVPNFLPKLVCLKVLICPYDIKESILTILLANCPVLETLVICFAPEGRANHGITGKCFIYLGNHIKHLILGNLVFKQQSIDYLRNSNGRSVQELEVLFPLLSSSFDGILELTNLRKLTFKACYCDFNQIVNLSTLVNLESLQVERLDHINDTLEELFTAVFQKCHKLREFKVSGVFKLYSHKLLEIIGENNLQLTHLHIYPNMYKKRMQELKHDEINLSQSIDILTSMKDLLSLALPHSDLNDDNLKSLFAYCPRLTTIDLSNCQKIKATDHIVAMAERNPGLVYNIYLSSTRVKSIPPIPPMPPNLKICACDSSWFCILPLIPGAFYDLI